MHELEFQHASAGTYRLPRPLQRDGQGDTSDEALLEAAVTTAIEEDGAPAQQAARGVARAAGACPDAVAPHFARLVAGAYDPQTRQWILYAVGNVGSAKPAYAEQARAFARAHLDASAGPVRGAARRVCADLDRADD